MVLVVELAVVVVVVELVAVAVGVEEESWSECLSEDHVVSAALQAVDPMKDF